ncbi:MAG: hypothetical protein E7571_09070 [Ruminococcaceae bacterium]|nr:hypothetical protein [Oscillospiraceae bacterium]
MSDELKDKVEVTDIDKENVAVESEEVNASDATVTDGLESPLVVHKKGDASYSETNAVNQMNETHTDEEKPTLARHRFRKEEKGHGKAIALLFVIVIAAAVFAGLYFTGNITFGTKESTTAKVTTTEVTTSIEEKYRGTIVVKDVYIFVDGKEVDGIEGLQKALEYQDKSTTAYKLIDENANADFFNLDVLELLTKLGFYGEDTETEHVQSTGLIAYDETTTLPPETTTKKPATSEKQQTTQTSTTKKNG